MSIGDWSGIAALITALAALYAAVRKSSTDDRTLTQTEREKLDKEEADLRAWLTAELMQDKARNAQLFDEVRKRGDLIVEMQKKHDEEIKALKSCDREKDERIAALEKQNKAQQEEIRDLRDENGRLRAALHARGIDVPPERRWADQEKEVE